MVSPRGFAFSPILKRGLRLSSHRAKGSARYRHKAEFARMTKPIVAWLDLPASPIREIIEETYTLVALKAGEPLPAQAVEARALITTGSKGPDAALIAQLPALEIIASNSVGYDAI